MVQQPAQHRALQRDDTSDWRSSWGMGRLAGSWSSSQRSTLERDDTSDWRSWWGVRRLAGSWSSSQRSTAPYRETTHLIGGARGTWGAWRGRGPAASAAPCPTERRHVQLEEAGGRGALSGVVVQQPAQHRALERDDTSDWRSRWGVGRLAGSWSNSQRSSAP